MSTTPQSLHNSQKTWVLQPLSQTTRSVLRLLSQLWLVCDYSVSDTARAVKHITFPPHSQCELDKSRENRTAHNPVAQDVKPLPARVVVRRGIHPEDETERDKDDAEQPISLHINDLSLGRCEYCRTDARRLQAFHIIHTLLDVDMIGLNQPDEALNLKDDAEDAHCLVPSLG